MVLYPGNGNQVPPPAEANLLPGFFRLRNEGRRWPGPGVGGAAQGRQDGVAAPVGGGVDRKRGRSEIGFLLFVDGAQHHHGRARGTGRTFYHPPWPRPRKRADFPFRRGPVRQELAKSAAGNRRSVAEGAGRRRRFLRRPGPDHRRSLVPGPDFGVRAAAAEVYRVPTFQGLGGKAFRSRGGPSRTVVGGVAGRAQGAECRVPPLRQFRRFPRGRPAPGPGQPGPHLHPRRGRR